MDHDPTALFLTDRVEERHAPLAPLPLEPLRRGQQARGAGAAAAAGAGVGAGTGAGARAGAGVPAPSVATFSRQPVGWDAERTAPEPHGVGSRAFGETEEVHAAESYMVSEEVSGGFRRAGGMERAYDGGYVYSDPQRIDQRMRASGRPKAHASAPSPLLSREGVDAFEVSRYAAQLG